MEDSRDPVHRLAEFEKDPSADATDLETVTTTAADVESAGRSCLAILGLILVIVVILLLWIVFRSTRGG
jgi:predicted RND superfamily exporter protein